MSDLCIAASIIPGTVFQKFENNNQLKSLKRKKNKTVFQYATLGVITILWSTKYFTLHGSWILVMSRESWDHILHENPSCQASSNAFVSGKPDHGLISVL